MARDGLLTNGDWVMPAAAKAAKLFSDPRLDLPAQCLAAMHPYALDYVEQAPVLVAAAADGKDMIRRGDRLEVSRVFKSACAQGLRLGALLQSYGIAVQLRALDGKAIRADQADLYRALSKVHPSTLAQRIPKSAERQVAWLQSMAVWRATMGRRSGDSNLLLEWAVGNIRDEQDRAAAMEVADFASQRYATFDVRWTMQQAIAASQRWHAELAMRSFAAEAQRPDWRTVIDYGPLPVRMEVDGYAFVALQTREQLYQEGAVMHHCVRTYADRVARGQSRIYSVCRGDTRVATLEIVPSMLGTGHFEYSQLKAVRNGRPENKATLATSAFIAKVNASISARSPVRQPIPASTAGDGTGAVSREFTAQERRAVDGRGAASRAEVCGRLGQEVYMAWFNAMELEGIAEGVLYVSFPTRFLRNWVETHYSEALRECCAAEFPGLRRIEAVLRTPRTVVAGPPGDQTWHRPVRQRVDRDEPQAAAAPPAAAEPGRTRMGAFEGSPLDPRHRFESFVVDSSNRMAHAVAMQTADTVRERLRGNAVRGLNPVFIHAPEGHGKTHLMHAIAHQVQQEAPGAQVLYLTAERFRFQFVQAMQCTEPGRFEAMLGALNLLLIDDLEFMSGAATEPAFERIIGALLDRGGQLVVASSRPPMQMERLSERMRIIFGRGMVTEIGPHDAALRLGIIEQLLAEKRRRDATFDVGRDILDRVATGSADASGRDLGGIMTQIHAMWSYFRRPITTDIADHVLHERLQRHRPPVVRLDDILLEVSRHYRVSRADILSQRRHSSIVWPRQVAMYLCSRLMARGLAEIGRRIGGRDQTPVLHAIRRVEARLASEPAVRQEIDAIRRALGCAAALSEHRRAA
jgi:chromosomal replication initiator protein